MPIHDWTRVNSGTYHDFHQDWTIEIRRTLNAGVLPPGYFAMADQRVTGPEPDIVALQLRKANRIVVRNQLGAVVALLEVVSPGNKDSRNAMRAFVSKTVEFLNNRIHLLIVDPFPPTPRDPEGIHHEIWSELTDEPIEARPANKPLTIAAYDAGDPLTAYFEALAVGDVLPDAPLFLEPGYYVNVPLEATYQRSWAALPQVIRDLVETPTS